MAGSGGDHWTFVGVVIVAEALNLVVWDPPEPLSLLISPDWLLRLMTLILIDRICYLLLCFIIFKVVKNNFKSFPKEQFMYIVRIYTIIMHLSFHEKMLQYQILL